MLCVLKIAFTVIEYIAYYWNITAQQRESPKVRHQSDHGTISALKEENYGYCPYSFYLTQGKILTEINFPGNAIAMDFAGHLSG